ncbi:SAM-dependent methyltransferase [Spirillospora sp. NPDC048911]|uniref:SAM-dependent methyltransferase n=1 Tax=Spirillospora sp. NPDC048911 TaxID=3364527 RepID=UPI00371CA077
MTRDWAEWHRQYDEPGSTVARRLSTVRLRVREALDRAPAGRIRLVSVCAGEGREVIPVLREHARGPDVTARLLELDPRIAAIAGEAAAGLPGVQVVEADAALTDNYEGAAPADVIVLSGVFGNLTDDSIERTISCLPQLCGRDATVLWTRHRRSPDAVPAVQRWFSENGFEELVLSFPDGTGLCVGVHVFRGDPQPLRPGVLMFTFANERTKDHWPDLSA